jgi:hypothetical protein
MATRPKLTPVEVLLRLQRRLEKRMEAIQPAKLDGYEIVISELEQEMDYPRRRRRQPTSKKQRMRTVPNTQRTCSSPLSRHRSQPCWRELKASFAFLVNPSGSMFSLRL